MKALQNMCWAAVLTATLNTGAATITDTFETTHDYAADGTTNTIWDGFFYNLYGGNTTLAAADANSSNSGVLTLRSTNGNWERGDNDGVLIYKNVNGDFDARVRVISMNNVAWHDAGLIARVADLAAAGAGEDWVAVKHFRHSGLSGHRSTDNNVSVTVELSGLQPWLRLTRQGNALSSYRSLDGTTWERISASTRDDMNGLALQVGIWQATFSNNEGTAQFDDFSLRTPDPWTNSAGGSWPVAGNWSNGVPTGAGSWLLFPGILSNNVSVTLDGNQTAGRIAFATTNNAAYSIVSGNPAGTLTLNDNIGVGGIFSALEIHSGSHSIAVPIALSNKVTVSIAANAELKLREGISGNGGLIKDGSGTLMLTGTHSTYSGNTFVNQGTLICLPLPAGIQAGYMFNNPNNLGEDSSINKNQLTGIGAPAYDANGRFGGALYLNGGSTLVSTLFPTGVPTGSTPYTIALWERSDGSADKGGFIGWGNNTANQCNNLRMDGDNRLNNYWYGNDWNLGGLSTNPKDGNWHHIAVTWDGSTQTMYLDGSQAGSVTRTGLNAQPKNFVIGKTTADVHFKGWLDNVQVANRAFSASEITALMQQSSATENMLPVGTSLHVAAGAMVDLNGSRQAVAVLTGGGRVTSSSLALAALTVGGENSSDFAGNFDGEIAINKVGTGSLKLSGLHVGSGDITVNSGTLVLSLAPLHSLLASSKIWFDAADATTLTTNATGVVTLWTNKGSAGATLDAVPIAAGAGPTVLPGALNNQPVLSLDATNGLRTAADAGVYGAQNRTLFAVGCRKNNGNMFLAHIGYGSDNQAFGIASQHNLLFGYTWGWGKDITFPARANSVYEIYDYMIENKQSTANLISGKNLLSGSLWTAPATVNTPLYLGSRFNDIGNGNIAEVILFDRALTPRERATIESYLRSKWFAANNTVALAAGTVLDLDSSTLTLGKLSGSGLVTNGTLGVTGTIAPGGTNSVGTLTMAGLTLQGGTLLTDVRTDGSCDLLEVEGPLDLTGFALQIADATQLRTGKSYLIASCSPGELTGTFAAVNLETGGWRVGYNNATGEVRLYCQGLVIMIQ